MTSPSSQRIIDSSTHSVLHRGFACHLCRKRKLRCDATRPRCQQCVKANRGDECLYDDGRTRTRTEQLIDRIKDLEERLRQYEAFQPNEPSSPNMVGPPLLWTSEASPSRSMSDPQISSGMSDSLAPSAGTSSRSGSDPGHPDNGRRSILNRSIRASPIPLPNALGWEVIPQGAATIPPSGSPVSWLDTDELPAGIDASVLLPIFLDHRHQLHFNVNVERFMQTLSAPYAASDPRGLHPCLKNAVYLLACHFSRVPLFHHSESMLLARTRLRLAESIEKVDRIFHFIQASCLVSSYLWFKGRVFEAYHLSCATARFSVGCGMHKIASPVWSPPSPRSLQPSPEELPRAMDPPRDSIELNERISTFWQVWMVDQTCAGSIRMLPALFDSEEPPLRLDTCFPMAEPIDDPEMPFDCLRSLYAVQGPDQMPRLDSVQTLTVKAMELYSQATRLGKRFPTEGDRFWTDFRNLDFAIKRFTQQLPLIQGQAKSPMVPEPANTFLILPHSLALSASIQLHLVLASDEVSYQICLTAATGIMSILRMMTSFDFHFLEAELGLCWRKAADVFVAHCHRLRQNQDYKSANAVEEELEHIEQSLVRLCTTFPVMAMEVTSLKRTIGSLGMSR